MYYIVSTLSQDSIYSTPDGQVTIIGRLSRRNDLRVLHPRGAMTEVTAAELDVLRRNAVFVAHERKGFVSVGKVELAPSKVAKVVEETMEPEDKASQDTIEKLEKKLPGVKKSRSKRKG